MQRILIVGWRACRYCLYRFGTAMTYAADGHEAHPPGHLHQKWRVTVVSLMFVSSVVYLGCASNSGLWQSESALSKSSTSGHSDSSKYDKLVKELETNGGGASPASASQSAFSKFGESLKNATSSVGSALTFEPQVVKAADPVSLKHMPENIHADIFYQAGQLAEAKGNRPAATKQYAQALEVSPEHLPSLIGLARLHDRAEDFSEAERLYRKAIEVAPENATAYNDLGLCLARNGLHKKSITALRHAVELKPDRKLYRNNLATVLVNEAQVDEALEHLLAAHPPAAAHYNVGYLLYQKGNKDKARFHFSIASKKDSSLTAATKMLARLDDNSPPTAGAAQEASDSAESSRRHAETSLSRGTKNSKPVAMLSQPELRRTPPADTFSDHDPPQPPSAKLLNPVPRTSSPRDPSEKPEVKRLPPQDAIQFPTQTMVEPQVHEGDDTQLPTPQLLKKEAGKDELPI
ncbi:MAG: tetratricopeptide repeat protein [Planctomycetota bacterium]